MLALLVMPVVLVACLEGAAVTVSRGSVESRGPGRTRPSMLIMLAACREDRANCVNNTTQNLTAANTCIVTTWTLQMIAVIPHALVLPPAHLIRLPHHQHTIADTQGQRARHPMHVAAGLTHAHWQRI